MQKTLAVVNLKKLKQNALFVRKILGDRTFYAVVKANAYGHGGARVALAIENIVDGFCVAITDEGAALRISGITKPILVLTPPLGDDDIARAKFYNLTVTVNSVAAAKAARGLDFHIKVNTGMNRLGCSPDELLSVLGAADPNGIRGVYSHLYLPSDRRASEEQLKLFEVAQKAVKRVNPEATAHIAASGGILSGEKFLKDGARCGILLYGYSPEGFSAPVEPILTVYARRTQVTEFIGGGAGYALAPKKYETLSAYRLGYADGFFRTCPLGVGNLCMDSFVREGGDELVRVFSDADDYALKCKTISYEALCSVTRRAEMVYEE